MAIKVQIRRDTDANWTSTNPTLSAGEVGFATTTKMFKIGDGSTAWDALPWRAIVEQSGAGDDLLLGDGTTGKWRRVTRSAAQSSLLNGALVFPASQSASADANALDDYEEGTWTPTALFSGGAGTRSYTAQSGFYTKIGRMVQVTHYLAFTKGTASGNFSLGGLPFTAGSDGSSSFYFGGATPKIQIFSVLSSGGTSLVFYQISNAGAVTNLPAGDIGTGVSYLIGTAAYSV